MAALVIGFGAYRVYLSFKPAPVDDKGKPQSRSLFAGGFYRMGGKTHLFVGIIYLLLGAALVATSFGFNPLGDSLGPSTEKPSKDNAPVKPGGVPVDQLPKK